MTTANSASAAYLRALDPEIPVFNVKTMGQVLTEAVWDPRLYGSLFGAFAAAALLLAAFGLYGVVSYSVSQRTKEIGVRIALGAQPGSVMRMVVGQGIRLTLIGLAGGAVGAYGMAKLMSGLLFGVTANDPFTFALMAALLALLASYVPARRALGIDPMTALRLEQ